MKFLGVDMKKKKLGMTENRAKDCCWCIKWTGVIEKMNDRNDYPMLLISVIQLQKDKWFRELTWALQI